MKSRLFTALCLGIAIIACNKEKSVIAPANQNINSNQHYSYKLPVSSEDGIGSRFISVDSANKMISSYLYSINSTVNDSDIRSFTVNADSLRAYLSNTNVKNVKLVFAHTLNYVNAGYSGQYAGYQSGALTIIIAGYDNSGNYIFNGGNVLDHVTPCPYACPSGTASKDLLE